MFDPRAAVASIAVISGVGASLGAAAPTSPKPAPDAPTAANLYCAVQALPEAAVRRGERSPVVCAATPDEAAEKLGDSVVSSFASASAFAAGNLLGIVYDGPAGQLPEYRLYGADCGYATNLTTFDDRASSGWVLGCSVMKLYNGPNFTGDSTPVQGPGVLGLPPPYSDNISSVKFRA